jgi:tetratricopeptide (TPR) repeat protein
MNTPWFGGGDTKKALALSQGGIDLGQTGFYVVRADAYRLRSELDAAHADYDTAMRLRVFKLSAFVEAAQAELGRKDLDRAKRYLEYALYCRPDATKAYEGLGDYYSATSDWKRALDAYQTAVEKDGSNEAAKRKRATGCAALGTKLCASLALTQAERELRSKKHVLVSLRFVKQLEGGLAGSRVSD